MKKLIYIIIFIFLIIGSHNYKELNDIAIITNISISEKNNNYQVTLQEIIPKKEDNKIVKDYKYYTNTSSTLKQIFHKLEEDVTKEIYLEHLENIIINTTNIKIIYNLDDILNSDLDNFNIILTEDNPEKIIKYSNNYKYINSIIKDNITLRSIKKAQLENKKIKIPIIKLENNKLFFYKYKMLGGKEND